MRGGHRLFLGMKYFNDALEWESILSDYLFILVLEEKDINTTVISADLELSKRERFASRFIRDLIG
jgi:hypothetical protein